MASLEQIVEALAAALEPIKTSIPDLQILGYMNDNPTPPSIDVYPDTPFQTSSGFGNEKQLFFVVRARTTWADTISGQRGLLRMLNWAGPESVQAALEDDQSLGGTVQSVDIVDEGVSGYGEFIEDVQSGGKLVGATWRVRVTTT